MPLRMLVLLIPLAALAGCGQGVVGTYQAEVQQVAEAARPAPGYSLEEVRQKLADASRVIELRSGGRFETREADRVVWEGVWRREGDQLLLRAQSVYGIAVLPALQDDVAYTLRSGTIVDEGTYSAYGLHLVYRKQ